MEETHRTWQTTVRYYYSSTMWKTTARQMAVGIPAAERRRCTDQQQSTESQMSDSLGAAPLAKFAPASLTSAPPGTRTGMETEEAVGTRKKKKRNNSGNDLGVSRTYGSTQFSMQRML